jgi:transcriptional regulator with XRE-family HTH domain
MGVLDDQARERIKKWLKTSGMSQVTFAERIGWSQPTVSQYLHGDHGTDMDTLARIARIFGRRFADLFSESEPPTDPPATELVTMWNALPSEEARAAVKTMMRSYPKGGKASGVARRVLRIAPAPGSKRGTVGRE